MAAKQSTTKKSTKSGKKNKDASSKASQKQATAANGTKKNGTQGTNKGVADTNGSPPTESPTPKGTSRPPSSCSKQQHSFFGILLRSLLLDIPVVTLFTLYLAVLILHHAYDEYYMPQAKLMHWTKSRKNPELTYYHRQCTLEDLTANTTEPLVITPDLTPEQCMHHQAKHGVSIYPNILTEETADKLHSWVIERNKVEEGFYVIENEHRYSFGIGVNQDPIVSTALSEIANHPTFRPAIEKICGKNPAVIEFTAITSEYGATDQFWHQDTVPSGSTFKYARSFLPSYSLFIPLQDTTAKGGATQICPGTHVCTGESMCEEYGFSASQNLQNVWPKGAGALVNQHMFHRGMGHYDPNGPDRVLFILTFAPRPRFGPNEVETRLFSQGGSYSIHWRQWGHTLNDFGNAPVAMAEPWKTIRSLGLYKPPKGDWGWDWVSVASMRITNNDNGYSDDDLYDFVDSGMLKWLPSWLQGDMDDDDGWYEYAYKTIIQCKKAVEMALLTAVGAYLGLFLLMDVIRWVLVRNKAKGSSFLRLIRRMIVLNVCVVLLAGYTVHHISSTQWARNIKNEKEYSLAPPTVRGTIAPGTLPWRTDVFVETRYGSDYLHGYNYILEDAHPGNCNFKSILVHNSKGYAGLPPSMKTQLCLDVIDWVGQNHGRFLTQNEEGNWSKMDDSQARRVIHKELMKHASALIGQVLTELSYLLSETKFGVFRDMAIHRTHIPDMLRKLQEKILDVPFDDQGDGRSKNATKLSRTNPIGRTFTLPQVPSSHHHLRSGPLRPRLPPSPRIEESYWGAWLSEGDAVEGKYQGTHNEWYRGTLVAVNTNKDVYDVEYDDGEYDEKLCRLCVRPYKPLMLKELVEVRDEEDGQYNSARIVKIHDDETYDLDSDYGLYEGISASEIRRFDPNDEGLKKGSRIQALFQGDGDEWYPGTIVEVNSDGTYDVVYDDGDKEFGVEKHHMREGF